MLQLKTKLLKTNVTALRFIDDFLLAGVGSDIHVLSMRDKWCHICEVLPAQNIYGIVPKGSQIIVYGGKKVAILLYEPNHKLNVCHSWAVQDWILDAKWVGDSVAFLTANNALIRFGFANGTYVFLDKTEFFDRCILYSGLILNTDWNELIVLAGTVFSEIIVWSNRTPPKLLHRLKGHKGVIFSVNYDELSRRISSTSDDRTVRIWSVDFGLENSWETAEIYLVFTMFGHTARVWKSHFLSDGRVISIGEDSLICVWKNGECDRQWSGHQGGRLWSVDSSEKLGLVATGGSDTGVNLWQINESSDLPSPLPFKADGYPKTIVNTFNGNIVLVTSTGALLMFTERWHLCFVDQQFNSYCLLSISPNRRILALGSINGSILTCLVSDNSVVQKTISQICDGRVYSLIWLKDDALLACGPDGNFYLLRFCQATFELEKTNEFILPKCKERWITCSALKDEYLICGDRNGSVHLYQVSEGEKTPLHTLSRIHGHRGVSDVKSFDHIISTGRDGTYKWYDVVDNELVVLSTYKLQMEWIASVMDTESIGCLIVGFHEVHLVVWSMTERRILLKVDCGGGHRSYDCFIHSNNLIISYIKDKCVYHLKKPFTNSSITAMDGWHPKIINAGATFRVPHGCYALLGGEDTTLRLVSLESYKQISVLRSHISNIRAITSCERSDSVFVASGGGRGQLILWKISCSVDVSQLTSYMIRQKNKSKVVDDPEMRFMDLKLIPVQCGFLILAACSDGFVRLLKYDFSTKTVSLVDTQNCDRCVLTVSHVYFNSDLVLTSGTDGKLIFWRLDLKEENLREIRAFPLHGLGVNVCDFQVSNELLVVATGSDDSSLALHAFNPDLSIKCRWMDSKSHFCQITGLQLVNNLLLSSGVDQRLTVFKWSFTDEFEVVQLNQIITCIPDSHGLLARVLPDGKGEALVFGWGVQVVEWDM